VILSLWGTNRIYLYIYTITTKKNAVYCLYSQKYVSAGCYGNNQEFAQITEKRKYIK